MNCMIQAWDALTFILNSYGNKWYVTASAMRPFGISVGLGQDLILSTNFHAQSGLLELASCAHVRLNWHYIQAGMVSSGLHGT